MSTFYHITKFINVPSILTKGLIPSVGDRSKSVGDNEECVYLCTKDSLPYWVAILGYDTVIKLDIDNVMILNRCYDLYDEQMVLETIPPDSFEIVATPDTTEAIDNLRESFIYSLCNCVVTMVRMYTDNIDVDINYVNNTIDTHIEIMNRFDLGSVPQHTIREWLIQYGEDGEYTVFDAYKNTGMKLYEWLSSVADDRTQKSRTNLYNWIKSNLQGCLDLNTGGFTG